MTKIRIHLTVDQYIWNEIKSRPELNEKVSSFVNDCLGSLLLDNSFRGESELLKEQSDLTTKRNQIDTELAVVSSRLHLLKEQQRVSANDDLRRKMDFARAARLNEV